MQEKNEVKNALRTLAIRELDTYLEEVGDVRHIFERSIVTLPITLHKDMINLYLLENVFNGIAEELTAGETESPALTAKLAKDEYEKNKL